MITRTCDICQLLIAPGALVATLQVPLAHVKRDDDDDDQSRFVGSLYHKSFDVCLGCARGFLRLKPTDLRALDEGERIALENHR